MSPNKAEQKPNNRTKAEQEFVTEQKPSTEEPAIVFMLPNKVKRGHLFKRNLNV